MLSRYAAGRAAAMKARQKVGATVVSSNLLAPTGTLSSRFLGGLGARTAAGSIDQGVRFASSMTPNSTAALHPYSSLSSLKSVLADVAIGRNSNPLRYSGTFHHKIQSRGFSSGPPGGFSGQSQPWVNPDAQVPGQNLEQYGVDLTKMAKEGKLDPVIGRRK
jgi:ATP-dependent Clp protease ATP-binding subunit ClpA